MGNNAFIYEFAINACPDEPVARLKYALEVLKLAATKICQDDGVLPLVVFDNTAQILTQPDGVKIIYLLQDTAKDMSDNGCFVCI